MKHVSLASLATALLLPLCVGCVTGQPIFRGQGPNGISHAVHKTQGQPGVASVRLVNHDELVPPAPAYCPPEGDVHYHDHGGHFGNHGPIFQDGHFSSRFRRIKSHFGTSRLFNHQNGPVGDWHPTHYHTFRYHAPQNLRYPPAQLPAGYVQYPYYTLRGPTDFFLAENPW